MNKFNATDRNHYVAVHKWLKRHYGKATHSIKMAFYARGAVLH